MDMDIVLGYIKDILGSDAFIGGAVVVAIIFFAWWAWNIRGKLSKVDSHEQHMNEFREAVVRINALPCANHEQNIGRHDQEHRDMEARMTRIETSMEYLQRSLDNLTKNLQGGGNNLILDRFTVNHSPLSISEKGREMMTRLGVQEMFNENWERIEKLIEDDVNDKTPYDIDQFCQEQAVVFPDKFLTNGQVNVLKSDAYKEGLSLTSYMRVIAVLARDRYFETHGITLETA